MAGTQGEPQEGSGDFRPARLLHVENGLDLQLVGEDDAGELFAVVDSNREYLREWLPWLDATNSFEDEKAFISNSLEEYQKREGVFYTIRLEGRIIGTISLNWIDWGNKAAGVGYWLSKNQSRKWIRN